MSGPSRTWLRATDPRRHVVSIVIDWQANGITYGRLAVERGLDALQNRLLSEPTVTDPTIEASFGTDANARIATLQQIVALALDGQTPQPDGYWYAPDENGDPHYRNDPVTPEQQAELDAIRQTNGVEE